MKKKFNTLFIFFLFFIAVVLTSSCSPIGALLVEPSTVVFDYIKAVPKKFLYGDQEPFLPADPDEGVEVFGVFGGEEELIPIDKVKIKIIYNPDRTGEFETLIPDNLEGFRLTPNGFGIIKIVISYMGLETFYHIQVGAPGTGSSNEWSGGVTGIIIEWN